MPEDFAGYTRCVACGAVVLVSFARQAKGRCKECWKDRHPLATLEIINQSVRRSASAMVRQTPASKRPRTTQGDRDNRRARKHAMRRLAVIFPDLYAMLLDEERAALGLAPIARYDPSNFEETASKTLGFEDVYDALDSSGATDA